MSRSLYCGLFLCFSLCALAQSQPTTSRPTLQVQQSLGGAHLAARSPDGRLLVTASIDGGATLWDAARAVVLRTWRLPAKFPTALCFLGSDKVFVELDDKFHIADARNGSVALLPLTTHLKPRHACLEGGRILIFDGGLRFRELLADMSLKPLGSPGLPRADSGMLGRYMAASPAGNQWLAIPILGPEDGPAEILVVAREGYRIVDRLRTPTKRQTPEIVGLALSEDARHLVLAETVRTHQGEFQTNVHHIDRVTKRASPIRDLPQRGWVQVVALDARHFLLGYEEETVVWDAEAGRVVHRVPGPSVRLAGGAGTDVATRLWSGVRIFDWTRPGKERVFIGSAAGIGAVIARDSTLTVRAGDRLRSFRFPELDAATFDVSGPLAEGVALKSLSDDGRQSIWSIPSQDVEARCRAKPEEIAVVPEEEGGFAFTTEHCFLVRDATGGERLQRMPHGEVLFDAVFGEAGRIYFATTELAGQRKAAAATRDALAALKRSGNAQSLTGAFAVNDAALAKHVRHHLYVVDGTNTQRRLASGQGDIRALAYLALRREVVWQVGPRVKRLAADGKLGELTLPTPDAIDEIHADGTHAYVITNATERRLTVIDMATGRAVASRSPWLGMNGLGIASKAQRVFARDYAGRIFDWRWAQGAAPQPLKTAPAADHDLAMPRIDAFDEIRERQGNWIIVNRLVGPRRVNHLWNTKKGEWWRSVVCAEPLALTPPGDAVLCRVEAEFALRQQQKHAVVDLATGEQRFAFSGESTMQTSAPPTAQTGRLPRVLPTADIVSIGLRKDGVRVLQLFNARTGAVRDLADTGRDCSFCKWHVSFDQQGRLGVVREWLDERSRRLCDFSVYSGPDWKRVAGAALPLRPLESAPTDVGLLVLGWNPRSAGESSGHELGEIDFASGSWRSIAFREGDDWSPTAVLGSAMHHMPGSRTALIIGRDQKSMGARSKSFFAHRIDLDSGDTAALLLEDGLDDSYAAVSLSPDGSYFAVKVGGDLRHRAVLYSLDPLKRTGAITLEDAATRLRWTAEGRFAAVSPLNGVIEADPATARVLATHRNNPSQRVEHLLNPAGKVYASATLEGRQAVRPVDADGALNYFPDDLPAVKAVSGTLLNDQFTVTLHEDGGLAVWDVTTRRWLARIFMSATGDWVVVDPEGRFDTSDIRGFNLARWSRADRPFESLSPEVFMRDYFEPRLLARLLARESFRPVRSLEKLNLNQPRVTLRAVRPDGAGKASVEVDVASVDGALVHDLRVFRDGQLVASAPEQSGALQPAVYRFNDIALPVGRSVEFSAYAFNADGVRSEYSRMQLEQTATAPPTRRAFVVSIGVNRTENPDFDLDFAAADARRLNAALIQRFTRSGRYARTHSAKVISDNTQLQGATKANIRNALTALAKGSADAPGPDDLVVLTFSGHGLVDMQGSFHLMPHDTGPGRGKGVGLLPEDLKRMIGSDELALWLRDIDAGEFVFIVDACHSAATVESPDFKPGPMASRGLGQMAFDKGMRILAATQANDVALEAQAIQQGLLSYALVAEGLDAFRADFKPQDRRILMDEWLAFAVDRVPTLTREIRTGQFKGGVGGAAPVRPRNAQPLPARIPLQRPSLFDFRQQRGDVVLQVQGGSR
ncbi:MAG: caspase family protein [Burkholderiales bacterium]|nr:caspase family protein [Burkholderiales bacterium]